MKFLRQVSTVMRSLTRKDGDLLSQFDYINEEIGADEMQHLIISATLRYTKC